MWCINFSFEAGGHSGVFQSPIFPSFPGVLTAACWKENLCLTFVGKLLPLFAAHVFDADVR